MHCPDFRIMYVPPGHEQPTAATRAPLMCLRRHHLGLKLGDRAVAEPNQLGDLDDAEALSKRGLRRTHLDGVSIRAPEAFAHLAIPGDEVTLALDLILGAVQSGVN